MPMTSVLVPSHTYGVIARCNEQPGREQIHAPARCVHFGYCLGRQKRSIVVTSSFLANRPMCSP
jgi:hypothetical protein